MNFGGMGSYSRDGSVIAGCPRIYKILHPRDESITAGCPRIFKILHHSSPIVLNWNINRSKRSADDPSVDSEKIVYYSRQRSIK